MQKFAAVRTGISAPPDADDNHVVRMTREARCAVSPRVKSPRAMLV